jgi:probable phosphoglycerate mutase
LFGRIVADSIVGLRSLYSLVCYTLFFRSLSISGESMRLLLIRHAESEHSHSRTIADLLGCTGLTTTGVQQAYSLQKRLRTMPKLATCAALLSSPVLRARQTADIVADSLPQCLVINDADLREIVPGLADGMNWESYRQTYGKFDLLGEPDRPFAPEGESWHGFLARVQTTLERLASQYAEQTVVAVTHAGFIIATLFVLFGIPRPGTGARLDPRYTSLTGWELTGGNWRLERYNDTCHLDVEPT